MSDLPVWVTPPRGDDKTIVTGLEVPIEFKITEVHLRFDNLAFEEKMPVHVFDPNPFVFNAFTGVAVQCIHENAAWTFLCQEAGAI